MKKIIIVFVLLCCVAGAFVIRMSGFESAKQSFFYRDDFDTLNKEFWFAGEWGTGFQAYDKLDARKGILNFEIKEEDRGPYLISKPIPIMPGDVITIKRRARMTYANEHFTGGLSIFQTSETTLEPSQYFKEWDKNFGDGVLMVEYVHNNSDSASRPGNDVFRVLPPNWSQSNAIIYNAIFNDWFEEELIYDTNDNKITYILDGQEQTIKGLKIDKPYIRLLMHNYGWYTGHAMKVDWMEINIINDKHTD